jgi:hypothetical protein
MKRLAALTLGLALCCSWSLVGQDKKDPPKETTPAAPTSNPYYPLKEKTEWTYKVQGGPITVKVIGTEKIKDATGYKLETSAGGKVTATEVVGLTKDGVARFSVNNSTPDTPILILKNDAKSGDSWTIDTKVGGQTLKGTFTVKDEKVEVPAGKYDTLHVVGKDMEIGTSKTTIEYWFAKDVGIVKLKFSLGSQEAVLELEKTTTGKK